MEDGPENREMPPMSQADIGDADTDTPKVRRWRLLGGIILSVIIAAITPIVLNLCMDADNPYRLVLPVLMAQVLMLAIVVVTKRASWAKPTFGVTWWGKPHPTRSLRMTEAKV